MYMVECLQPRNRRDAFLSGSALTDKRPGVCKTPGLAIFFGFYLSGCMSAPLLLFRVTCGTYRLILKVLNRVVAHTMCPPKIFILLHHILPQGQLSPNFSRHFEHGGAEAFPWVQCFQRGSPGLVRPGLGRKGPGTAFGPNGNRRRQEIHVYVKGPEHMLRAPVSGGGYSLSR